MAYRNNFICDKCKRKLTWWEIHKLSFGSNTVKKFTCKCGNVMHFNENILLKYLPAPFVAAIIFIPKTFLAVILWLAVVIFLLFLYFVNLKKIQ